MFTRIQVALDGSPFSEQSLPVAVMLAKRFDADLNLITVHEPVVGVEMEGWDQSAAEWSQEYVDRAAAEVAERSGIKTCPHLVFGTPVRAILDHAERAKSDLLVAATHGRGVLSRAWLGSVADGLLRHASIPVLLVRPDESDPPAADAPEATPWSRILVPLDGSEFSAQILDDAIPLARAFGAKLELVRVVPFPLEIASPYLPTTIQMNQEVVSAAKAAAEDWLAEQARRVHARGVEVSTHVRVAAQPAHAICETAAETGAELIVMATHGRSGLGRAFLGSTADKVVRSTHLPVLVHRPASGA